MMLKPLMDGYDIGSSHLIGGPVALPEENEADKIPILPPAKWKKMDNEKANDIQSGILFVRK